MNPESHRKALITGASEGLGRVFAEKLAAEGYDTVAVARNEARLAELVAGLGEGKHEYFVADLATRDGVQRCVERLQQEHFDLLVNNAGFSRFGRFREASRGEQESILDVNCRAVLTLAHAFLEQARSGDAMINLSSITNFLPTPIQPTYCATKAFIASLSESLWYQERGRGVYVQGLCPGVTRTEFVSRAGTRRQQKLLDRVSGSPERVIECSLRELRRRRRPIVIPGAGNRFLAALSGLLPRKWLVAGSGRLGEFA